MTRIRRKYNQRQKSQLATRTSATTNIPAPVGGLNTRDAPASMPELDALALQNWIPEASGVRCRRGSDDVTTGYASAVETVIPYQSGATKLFITAEGTTLYTDDAGGTATSIGTSLSNARWQGVQLGSNMMLANGADAPRNFDGTTLTTITFTGDLNTYGPAKIHGFHKHKNRVYAWDVDYPNFFYGGVDAVAGAFTEFPLENVSDTSGNIVEIKTISRDAGNGPDDFIAFILDTGEVIIYQGSDPGTASDWSIVGKYQIPPIIGIRCAVEFAGDVWVLTQQDYIKLSDVIKFGAEEGGFNLNPSKLSGAIARDYATYGSNYGWSISLYPGGGWMIINVPEVTNSSYCQYVVNLVTQAATQFTGWTATVFGTLNQKLYFGSTTALVQGDVGDDDNDVGINLFSRQASSILGTPRRKRLSDARLYIESEGDLSVAFGVGVDFSPANPSGQQPSEITGAEWNVALWDVAEWAGNSARTLNFGLIGFGVYVSPEMSMQVIGQRPRWNFITYNFDVSQTY